MLKPKRQYIYAATHEGEIVYIGRGKGLRWSHCTSGISSSYYLNRLHFDGANVETMIVKDDLSDEESYALEGYLIAYHRPKGNSVGKYEDLKPWEQHLCNLNLDYSPYKRIVKGYQFAA